MDGGRGIEMLLVLALILNLMDAEAISDLIVKLQNLKCSNSQDLSSYFDNVADINSQHSWVGQSFPVLYLIHSACHRASPSWVLKNIFSCCELFIQLPELL